MKSFAQAFISFFNMLITIFKGIESTANGFAAIAETAEAHAVTFRDTELMELEKKKSDLAKELGITNIEEAA